MRKQLRLTYPLIAALGAIMLLAASSIAPAAAQQDSNARDAVSSLKAYALFKAGDFDAARTIWESLAARGNTTAMINLANLFQQGMGVNEDDRQALEYIRQAAELGDARAQYELGIEYEKGILVVRNLDKAAHWLKRSAEQDNADGQFAYGILLATRGGPDIEAITPSQREEALQWLERARVGGHPDAYQYIRTLRNTSPARPDGN